MLSIKPLNLIVSLLIMIASCQSLTGCSIMTAPKMQFPAAPAALMAQTPNLTPLPANKKTLADLLENANNNNAQYYILKKTCDQWPVWYKQQAKIYNGAP